MLSQDLKPLPNSKCHCFLQKYKLRSKYRAILHFHVKEIPKLADNSSSISFFSLWNNTDESTSKLCPPGFKLRLQLMTGVFQIQCLLQWVVHVMSKYFILKSPKGMEKWKKKKDHQIQSEKFPLFLHKPNEIQPWYMSAPPTPSIQNSYQKPGWLSSYISTIHQYTSK